MELELYDLEFVELSNGSSFIFANDSLYVSECWHHTNPEETTMCQLLGNLCIGHEEEKVHLFRIHDALGYMRLPSNWKFETTHMIHSACLSDMLEKHDKILVWKTDNPYYHELYEIIVQNRNFKVGE